MNDEEMHKMYLTHFLYKNGIIEPKPEAKKDKKSDSKEVKIFLANGKTLYFGNVSSVKELDENDKMVLLIKHFNEEINKKRISCFDLTKENIIGYSIVDDDL